MNHTGVIEKTVAIQLFIVSYPPTWPERMTQADTTAHRRTHLCWEEYHKIDLSIYLIKIQHTKCRELLSPQAILWTVHPKCDLVGFQTETDFHQMIKHTWQLGSYSWKNRGTKFLFSENPRHKYRQVWLQDVVLKIHTVHSYRSVSWQNVTFNPDNPDNMNSTNPPKSIGFFPWQRLDFS